MDIDKQPLQLSEDFNYVLDLLEKSNRSLFITGKAGTGKSTLLQLFRNTTRKKTVVLAPTGIAALNVKGQTIHSFFGFPPRLINKSDIKKRRNRKLYKRMEVLIIDEISMVRADLIDHMDHFLRLNRENHEPFGGVQCVFFGDLFQLPPVLASETESMVFQLKYNSPYFFSAAVFEKGFEMEMVELSKVYRQENRHFLRLLDALRHNRLDREDLEDLNDRYLPDFKPQDFYITLSPFNAHVDAINRRELNKISSPVRTYPAATVGNFNPRLYPTEAALNLKLNAQVMLIRNDPNRQYVNGTIGKAVELEENTITVMVEEDQRSTRYIEVERAEWEILKYKPHPQDPNKIETEVIGTFIQFPLKLAWAVTIHKAQGKTFEKVIIDMGKGAFEHGQTYVALSRCRTLEGIVLKQPLRQKDVMVDERIVEFHERNF